MMGHSLDDHGVVNSERKDRRGGDRNENRGPRDQTVTSNKAMFTKNTHISFPPLSSRGVLSRNNPVYLRLLPMSARPQTRETVLIPAPGSLALVTNTPHTDRPEEEVVTEEGCRGKGAVSQGFQQQGLDRGLKLNRVVSDTGNGSQGIPPHKATVKTAEKQHA
ncbi:hypothetical protein ROHU_016930 [Labeo rohita]|uniref:Uncharacterized protein n=1 Tax=Labeo rohita TaxID=84645 RepID=A0A498NI38_LABRO|nr:hypothetical protein ROHU_016930 [Labeo rohita]